MTQRICSIEGCGKPHSGHGWCNTHYQRWYKYGDPLASGIGRIYPSQAERFWRKVDKRGPADCWPWLAHCDRKGYGKFARPGKGQGMVRAHRFVYELVVGAIPTGLTIDHLCRNPSCVNPAHLEPVTNAENVRRGRRSRPTLSRKGSRGGQTCLE